MVTDEQVRRLFMLMKDQRYEYQAADKAGMTARTARKENRLVSGLCMAHILRDMRHVDI